MNRFSKADALRKLYDVEGNSELLEKLKALAEPKTTSEVLQETSKENPYLGAIAMTESRGGEDLNHKIMNHGLHAGTKAGGLFGMMPLTAKETLKNNPDLAAHYPELTQDTSANEITERFNTDPEAAADFAKALYERNKAKTGSDEGAVYAQYNGLTGALRARNRGSLANSPYVQKVKSYTLEQPETVNVADMDLEKLLKGFKYWKIKTTHPKLTLKSSKLIWI